MQNNTWIFLRTMESMVTTMDALNGKIPGTKDKIKIPEYFRFNR